MRISKLRFDKLVITTQQGVQFIFDAGDCDIELGPKDEALAIGGLVALQPVKIEEPSVPEALEAGCNFTESLPVVDSSGETVRRMFKPIEGKSMVGCPDCKHPQSRHHAEVGCLEQIDSKYCQCRKSFGPVIDLVVCPDCKHPQSGHGVSGCLEKVDGEFCSCSRQPESF